MSRRIAVASLWLILATYSLPIAADERRILAIQDIIDNVHANEALYADIDLSLTFNNRTADGLVTERAKEGEIQPYSGRSFLLHYVSQQGKFRVDREGEALFPGGNSSLTRIRAFDGETTRLFDKKQLGNIIDGRAEDENVICPHMTLIQFMNFNVPLSTYLSGDAAMRSHPNTNWDSGHKLSIVYHGDKVRDSMTCHHVSVTTLVNSKPWDRWDLWLAEERNYIPVAMEGYTFITSETMPVSKGVVVDWVEIKPGIWFPKQTNVRAFNPDKIRNGEPEVEVWQEKLEVTSVSLDPDYDASYFSDVRFPEGTPVYHVAQRKIVDEHIVGAPRRDSPPPAVSEVAFRWWIVWVNVGVAAAAFAAWFTWKRVRA